MSFNINRYDSMHYRRCGRSGLMLPAISLGMWHNFGTHADHETCTDIMRCAFDLGITHFDLANNYGPVPGSAEERVGKILKSDFAQHRHELIISSKAGYRMWPGPYGEWGSKKYLVSSLEQSLKRLDLDYVDIFYSHRPDPDTPLEETLGALDQIVRQGKALYAGISNYRGALCVEAMELVKKMGWSPIVIHQPNYNMFDRWIENDLLDHTDQYGTGVIVFSPLAQGLLTSKYLDAKNPIPENTRASDPDGYLKPDQITPEKIEKVRQLNDLAEKRGQSMAQLAIAWTLRNNRVTSALIGARNSQQLRDSVGALENLEFSSEVINTIETILKA